MMYVSCSNCWSALLLPQNAPRITCTVCQAIIYVPYPPHLHNYQPPPSHPPPPLVLPPSPYSLAPCRPPCKKAVICGISYRGFQKELKGCIIDAKFMRHLLISHFHFPESLIVMLTDEETDPYRLPTKQNMKRALSWLVQGCQPGDSLVFHYSGHGSQQMNYYGDEFDGYDETLCPLDADTQGMIVDDEINAAIVNPLPYGVRLHAIIDACHSGTVLDLPYLCKMDRGGRFEWEDHRPLSGAWKGTNGGEVISFSSCDDLQSSADTWKNPLSNDTAGAPMTYYFIQAIEHGKGATYGSILKAMKANITSNVQPQQDTQLSASEKFDIYKKPFSL